MLCPMAPHLLFDNLGSLTAYLQDVLPCQQVVVRIRLAAQVATFHGQCRSILQREDHYVIYIWSSNSCVLCTISKIIITPCYNMCPL